MGWRDAATNHYKPWEHRRQNDRLRDYGTLVGGVWVDNTPRREAFRIDEDRAAREPVLTARR